MTRPTYFSVEYAINPWMDTGTPVDGERAVAQWQDLHDTYRRLGHTVDLVEPVPGLPDMVYAANAGLIINGAAIVARFKHAERADEATAYAAWMGGRATTGGHPPCQRGPGRSAGGRHDDPGGHRVSHRPRAHDEVAAMTGMPVVSLELVDPRFYHLDTALTVLDDTTIAYYPPAFTARSRALLQQLFPDAIEVSSTDAYVLGLNAVSDGRHVVHPAQATGFAEQLYHAGFHPIGVDLPNCSRVAVR